MLDHSKCNVAIIIHLHLFSSLFSIVLLQSGSLATAIQYAGDPCTLKRDGGTGVCKSARDCPQAFIDKSQPPDLCSFIKNDVVICCPSAQATAMLGVKQGDSIPTGPRKSFLKCEEYSKLSVNTFAVSPLVLDPEVFMYDVPNCDYTTPLIVDGEKTNPGEFPHMAAIGWYRGGQIEFHCGGVLISDDFILTVAHCSNLDGSPPTMVRLGDQNLVRTDDNVETDDVGIKEIIVHPSYKRPSLYNDIALLRLNRKVAFSKFIRPACMWQTPKNDNFTEVVATGWGLTTYAGERSDELLKVPLQKYTKEECGVAFPPERKLPNGIIESQFCAGNKGGIKDTCQGDSGGPLQIVQPGNVCVFHVVALTSFGKSCGSSNSPGVYTRVASFLDWIESNVWP